MMAVDPCAGLAYPRIDPDDPLLSAFDNERLITARLRERHPTDPDEWATWENVQRVRHGDPPKKRQKAKRERIHYD